MEAHKQVGSLPRESLLAVIWTSCSIATLLVILRTAIRLRLMSRLTMEDYWMFLALASLITSYVIQTLQIPTIYYILATIAGVIPISADLISATEAYLRYEFAIIALFWTSLWCVKASFLALYFKLFRELPVYRRVWYALAAFTFCAYVGCWVTLLTACRPVSNFFKFQKCNSKRDIWASNLSVYYSTAVDVFTDICSMWDYVCLHQWLLTLNCLTSDGYANEINLQSADLISAKDGPGLRFRPLFCDDNLCHNSSKAGFGRAILCKSRPIANLVDLGIIDMLVIFTHPTICIPNA